ncbi:hypothetical protein IWX76_003226 [Pedobacter sp. CAN_A7]|uniref:capsule assembly Wzi family protein n=1 Tax=Pedobacter sp. CAN_A7 TaxID=2787722 RepID=UPI0018CAA017
MKQSRNIYILFFILALTCSGLKTAYGQTLPVGSPGLDDYYRRLQLMGKLDSNLSFAVRPLFKEAILQDDIFDPDSLAKSSVFNRNKSFASGNGTFQLLPVSWQQHFNSNHPYGWNDGGMIPAKGYQTMVTAGFFAKFGPLSIQLKPEMIYAANADFKSFGDNRSDADLRQYYSYHNFIDAPERFGDKAYQKLLWGQSSIRLTFGPASIGLSNENLWWGPGMRNSLMMSNNAQGFKHVTLNTVRPIRTGIGSFEGQVISARLDDSGFAPLPVQNLSTGLNLHAGFRKDWRYLTGFNLNYQPKWVPGLFLGFTRTFSAYHSDLSTFSDYFPFFTPFQKNKVAEDGQNLVEETFDRDQRTSLYARWIFPKAHAEIYFEYALNDNSFDFRDFIGSPDHSRAYLFGLSKLVSLGREKDEFIQVNAELTQLSQTTDGLLVRSAGTFYHHGGVRQGYTHKGEVIGAGTGSGGNLQSLELNWVKGLKKLGLGLERYEHGKDFSDRFAASPNGSRKWVDFAVAAQGSWDYNNLIFNAKLQGIKSLNYQWRQKDFSTDTYYIPHNDAFNIHGEIGITYRF